MKKYTVLLLRTAYVADNYGEDTFMTHVNAESVGRAKFAAQLEAAEADFVEDELSFEEALEMGQIGHDDYAVLMVIEGHHNDIKEV